MLIPRAARFREKEKVLYPAAALLLMTASFILTKTGRDALYFQKDGLFDLPWAYLGIATLAVPVAMMTLSLTKRLGLRPMRIVLPLTVALVQAVFYVVAEPGGGVVMTLFFMSIPLIYGVMFSTTWLFGGELVETLPKERLSLVYGRLGSASMVGGLLGAGVAKLLAARLAASAFILLGTVGLLLAVGIILLGHAKFPFRVAGSQREDLPAEPSEMMPAFSEIFNALRFDYVRTLVLVAGAAAVVGVLIEFQFYVLASLTTTGGRESTDFFANFYIVLTLVALLRQLFAMPTLQRKIGIRGSLLVLPLSLLSGNPASRRQRFGCWQSCTSGRGRGAEVLDLSRQLGAGIPAPWPAATSGGEGLGGRVEFSGRGGPRRGPTPRVASRLRAATQPQFAGDVLDPLSDRRVLLCLDCARQWARP